MDRANPALSLPYKNAQPVPKQFQIFHLLTTRNLVGIQEYQTDTKSSEVYKSWCPLMRMKKTQVISRGS